MIFLLIHGVIVCVPGCNAGEVLDVWSSLKLNATLLLFRSEVMVGTHLLRLSGCRMREFFLNIPKMYI
jgi:hypothetical protein